MQDTQAFAPSYKRSASGTTQVGTFNTSLTVTPNESSATAGTLPPAGQNPADVQIQIANTTLQWAYVNVGKAGAVTAATVAASYPIAPGSVVVVTVDPEVDGVSVILGAAVGAGGTTLVFTRGGGL